MRRGIWSVPSTLCSYIKTPLPTLCFTFFFRVTPGASSLYLPPCFWSWGTYLLRLTELQPRVLQHMLVTHGVALEVAAFPCHHITPQGKEAGLQVVFPERDLKRKGHHSQPRQQGSRTRPGSWHRLPGLTEPPPFLLLRKASALASLTGLLSTCAGPGTRIQGEAHIPYV